MLYVPTQINNPSIRPICDSEQLVIKLNRLSLYTDNFVNNKSSATAENTARPILVPIERSSY